MRQNDDGRTVAAMDMLVPRVISGFSIHVFDFSCSLKDDCLKDLDMVLAIFL